MDIPDIARKCFPQGGAPTGTRATCQMCFSEVKRENDLNQGIPVLEGLTETESGHVLHHVGIGMSIAEAVDNIAILMEVGHSHDQPGTE